ncbi:hypothetical protein ASPWEDRAFT_169476 [Aspergillus wentii DTO 134E9]|uniref:Uncharacterized protein n=1 Tax=Aspergillus wentii DTO 134E9 TaxID=1073089 RepID=A0A1L9RXN8_ASPWE|nr:uncharacterized protein ASPWEDRAFT_169476 [Aspergillus wentii DTO 134E9]OJJ39644.1 hypothetical protein ASPWEDRAFT_169476 [Aspergillus wentii DTO 134E9]
MQRLTLQDKKQVPFASGGGWLIFYADWESQPKGELIILNTSDFSGPIAIAQLPYVLHSQVHDNWAQSLSLTRPLPPLTGPIKDAVSSNIHSYTSLHGTWAAIMSNQSRPAILQAEQLYKTMFT